MRKRSTPVNTEETKQEFDLFDHKREILQAFENDKDVVILEGRRFLLALHRVSNVDYIVVSPEKGFVPAGNFIRNQREYDKEMNRRASEADSKRSASSRKR